MPDLDRAGTSPEPGGERTRIELAPIVLWIALQPGDEPELLAHSLREQVIAAALAAGVLERLERDTEPTDA